MAKAARNGKLGSTDTFTCPKCGCQWRAAMVGELRNWEPETMIEIFG